MYPHADGIRRRGVRPPPMAPGHIMGMPQQPPGVMMPMHNQPVQILQQNQHQHQHYPSQNQYQHQPPRQNNITPPYVQHQQPHHTTSYHHQQPFTHSNTQVVLTKQAVNHNKNYREEYSVVKEPVAYGGKDLGFERRQQPQPFVTSGYASFNSHPPYSAPPAKLAPLVQKPLPLPPQPQKMAHPSSPPSQQIDKENEPPVEDDDSDSTTREEPTNSAGGSMALGAKEKTPMCLVNELARFNKINHQYKLTNEMGPAHKKNFTVTLNLGTEEYTAEGPSIKKAQHAAAAVALVKTKYTHPTPKHHKHLSLAKANMTPTVELNALAMKRGEPAIYKMVEAPHSQFYQPHQTYTFRRPYAMPGGLRRGRALYLRGGRMPFRPSYPQNMHYTVSLKVGSSEFIGEGNSPQSARHDAAAKALAQLRLLPIPENSDVAGAEETPGPTGLEQDLDTSIKSPISLVHEIALKRDMSVLFHVVSEKGPPHMKTFITECVVGKMRAEGEGNGKKISKKRAAENMLSELKKLPPLSPTLTCVVNVKRKPAQAKKKTRNLIKITQDQKPESEVEEINPISRLIQIQQLKKEREPVYSLLEEKGLRKRREFIMEVAIGQLTAIGCGPNKKAAKKNAAQNLLAILEDRSQAKPDNTVSAETNKEVKTEKKTETPGGSSGRQLAPGLLLVSEQHHFNKTSGNSGQGSPKSAEEQLNSSSSSSTSGEQSQQQKSSNKVFRSKDQLLYLADLLHFQVQFSDYPKANHREFLSLVSLSTDPPQVCHGSGPTIEESHDQAASTALRALSEMGLDSVTPTKEKKGNGGGKSGPTKK